MTQKQAIGEVVIKARTIGALGVLAAAVALPAAAQDGSPDAGHTAWMLTATALVLLMTLPGLALFYAGLVRAKNVLSVMMHCVSIAALMSLVWIALGYSLAFSGSGPLFGDLAKGFLAGVGREAQSGAIPETVFVMFQMTFAIITPALIVGAYVERIKFSAVLVFSALWLLIVYAPVAHWVWGGGWLAKRGVMDFAGGLVVHATAGTSALVAAAMLGPRDGFPREVHPPHSPALTMIGAALLWVGWFGFNAGSALRADGAAGMAMLATHLSACAAGLTWALLERLRFGKPSMIGAVTGVIAGLATVTPASGYIGPMGGVTLGVAGALVCFYAVTFVKQTLKVDDSLDVFAVHGVGGLLGTLGAAVLAAPGFGGVGYAATGTMTAQFSVQLLGAAVTVAWSALATVGIVIVTRRLAGFRASDGDIEEGLDLAAHGERASTP
jgi:Amt family ammonium transporter